MSVRFLHCSDNVRNYNICIEKQICGFTGRGQEPGDTVYLVVKKGKDSFCGARCKLTTVTDESPWHDGVDYANIMRASNFEFCRPFSLSFLARYCPHGWALKFFQGAKPIKEREVINELESHFNRNRISEYTPLVEPVAPPEKEPEESFVEPEVDDESIEDPALAEIIKAENPDVKMNIMGTFQAIQFLNESDKINGLEIMVNENFYSLFTFFQEEKSVFIPDNRLFMTEGACREDGSVISGIRSIPDALLVKFDPNMKECPLQVNLIEYECFGQRKNSSSQKSSYLNTTVIPQLMRFAAAFSIITDRETRRKTIENWVEKLMDYICKDARKPLEEKMVQWVKSLNPYMSERAVYDEIKKLLRNAFETNIRILLIIDELSREQKTIIKNIINAFKLENGSIGFEGYVVSLVQRINVGDTSAQYALTIQN